MAELNSSVFQTFVKSFSCERISEKDVEDFGQRVFSFIEGQKWVSRPLILSPSICARYGWKCVHANLLECVACGAKLCTQEPKIEIYDAYKSCLDKIVADLKDGHKTHCPWPLAPSPESFVKMVPLPKEEALNQFVNRLKPCLEFKSSIPQIKDSVLSELDLKQGDVLSLYKFVEITPSDINLIGISAACFAATGWTLVSKNDGELKTYIKCDSCQRLIWNKSFNSISVSPVEATSKENGINAETKSSTTENGINSKESPSNVENSKNSGKDSFSNEESSMKSGKESTNKRSSDDVTSSEKPHKRFKLDRRDFDPLEEHRPWCRWVSFTDAKNQSPYKNEEAHTSVPGWKLYMKSLLRNISSSQENSSETTPSKEHVRSVRNLLESWTSPTSL